MSQFQIQGPQAIVQPAKPIIYQESRTILPQQQITVTQGIDLGKIGQAAANLGIETVNVINEHKAQVTEAAIRKQTFATDAALKLAAERGDWATYDSERTKFGDLVKINLGYDPNTDEQPVGKIPAAILANTRSSIAKWDNDKSVAQGEYDNLVELDTAQRFYNMVEADIQALPPEMAQGYIDSVFKPELEEMYKAKFKSDMFTENTSRTKSEKAYARSLEAKWLDAQSLADKAMRGVKTPTMIESFDEKARVMLTSADSEFDAAAADLAAIATVLDKTPWDKLTPEEREKSVRISTLVSRGEQKLTDTMDTYLRIAYAIDEDRNKPASFEKSRYNLKNKLSDEAYDIVTDLPGFSPEAANKLAQTRKSLGAFGNNQLVFIRKQSESILEAAVAARELSISIAARAATTQIDYLTDLSKEKPELSNIIEQQQNKILAGVQQKIMETLTKAAPTSSRALFDKLIESLPSQSSTNPLRDVLALYKAPSFELDVFGSYIDSALQTPRFQGEYNKYNEEYMKLASHVYGKTVGSEDYNNRRKKANDSFIRSQKIISASITGGVLVDNQGPPTSKEYLDAGLLALSSRMSSKDLFKEDGNMKTWEEVQLELNDGDKTALFNLELFQHTPYYDAFLQDLLNKRTTDTDSPRSVIEKTFASILSGPKGSPVSFDDIKNTQRHSVTKSSFTLERKNTFERGFKSEDPNTQTAFQSLALTLSPDDRDSLIVHLETSITNVVDPMKKNQLTAELNKFKTLNTSYDGTNPFEFVKKAPLSSEQISNESSIKEANRAAEGSRVVPNSDKTPNAAELQKRAIVPYQKLMEEIYPSLTPGDQHDNPGSIESFRSALVLDLTKETEATRTITIRKQVDSIILEEALVLERTMSKDKEDFKPTLITKVNKRLSSLRLDYDVLRGYTRTSKGSKTDMPKNLTTSSGMNDLMFTDQIILNSKPLVGLTKNTTDVPMKPELAKTMLGQFMQVDEKAANALSVYTDTLSPEIAAVVLPIGHKIPGNVLGLAKGSGGKAGLIIALATGALGSNTDSAAILAAQYALQAIPDTINTEEQAVKWVTSEAAKIRKQLLEGSIFLTTENRQSYLDPDNVAPTYILYRGNKEYATLQPNSNTVSESLKDTEVGKKFIKSLDMKDAISKYNTFPESTEPEGYAPAEGRDFFVRDWLLSQPQPNLSFVPNPQKDRNLAVANLLGATRFVYRKTTLDDGSVTVNRVLQQPSYNGNTTVWQDTEKLYPEKYDAVYNKGYFKTYYGLDPVTHTWLPNNTPVKVGDSSTGVPNKYEYSTSSPVRSIETAPQYGAPVLLYNSGPTKKDRLDDALSNFDIRTQATISRASEIAGVEGQQLITDVNRIEVAAEADTQNSQKNDTLRLLAKSINFTPYVEPTRETPGLWTTKVKTPLKSEDGTIKVDFEYLLDVFESPIPDQAGVPRRLIKPTVIYYNKKFILVPNPYNLEPEVLKDKYATENKSFAIFKNRDDATAYGESFTAYVNTVQQNFMNFYKQQQ